jgi:hypothetical protein
MAKVHRIHSMPDDAPGTAASRLQGSAEHPRVIRALDGVLRAAARRRRASAQHPPAASDASTAEIVRMLERRYLAAVTTGGAAVGATAVVPGIGTG